MVDKTRLWLSVVLALLALAGGAVAGSVTEAEETGLRAVGDSSPEEPMGGGYLVSWTPYEGESPAIARNPDDEQYLVAWVEPTSEDESDLFGQIHAADGRAVGDAFQIASAANVYHSKPVRFDVAYNPTHHQYLVTWESKFPDAVPDPDIFGRIFSAEGVPQGSEFPIYQNGLESVNPGAISGAGDEYLVAWVEWGGDGYLVYGKRLGFDGSLLDNPDTWQDESEPGIGFLISSDQNSRQSFALAYNDGQDEYLVVWDEPGGYGQDIVGRRVEGANGYVHPTDILISSAPGYQGHPAVTYNPDAQEYLVVWEDTRWGSEDIFGQRLAPDGDLLRTPADVNLSICEAARKQLGPAVAYNRGTGQYLVVWHDERHESDTGLDIYGIRVAADGAPDDEGDFAISEAEGDQQSAAVAAHVPTDPQESQYLVVWQDGRDGLSTHVFAQRVWWTGALVGHQFELATPMGTQESPAVAYDSTHGWYLAAWADARGGDDRDIYGQLLNREGSPMGGFLVLYEGPGDQSDPALVYNPLDDRYLVVWESITPGRVLLGGRLLSAQGTAWSPAFTLAEDNASFGDPAIAHNAHPDFDNYLVVFSRLSTVDYDFDIHGWLVATDGQPAPAGLTVCDEASNQQDPAVAYSPGANEFLVAWEDARAEGYDVYGQLLQANLVLTGSQIVVAAAAKNQSDPAVVHNPETHEYLVAWEDSRTDDAGDIYAQRILSTGILTGGNIAIPTSAAEAAQSRPAVLYVDALDRYRILWRDNRDHDTLGMDIYGQWLNADGTFPGTVASPVVRFRGDQWQLAVAYDPGYRQAITVWEDWRREKGTDIYASMNALDRTAPLARFVRRPVFGQAGQVFAFNARPSIDDATARGDLRVRWDLDDDGTWDGPLSYRKGVTSSFSMAGVHTITLEVWDEANHVGRLSLPVFVSPPGQALSASPPTATVTASPTWGVAGTVFAFDGTGSTGSGPLQALWDWENDGLFDTAFSSALTASHTYTVARDYTVRLLVQDTTTRLDSSAFRRITVQAGAPVELQAVPHTVTTMPGEVLRFRALAWDAAGNRMRKYPVTWSLADPTAGEISVGGVFTAGTTAGAYADAITVQANRVLDTASVVVAWPRQVYLPLVLRATP